jgi:Flp pilus assembly protein TadG
MTTSFSEMRRTETSRRGVAATELALCLPLLVALILGLIECGRAMQVEHMVSTAAREGARMAILEGSTNEEVEEWATDVVVDTLGVDRSEVSVEIGIENTGGDDLEEAESRDECAVTVSVPHSAAAIIGLNIFEGQLASGRAMMRHE